MILNPIRLVRCVLIERDLNHKLSARKAARERGETLVVGHSRRKA
jgi:hypothetical protein